jgi:hypothetical protein
VTQRLSFEVEVDHAKGLCVVCALTVTLLSDGILSSSIRLSGDLWLDALDESSARLKMIKSASAVAW